MWVTFTLAFVVSAVLVGSAAMPWKVCNIRDYGAKGDNATYDTAAFKSAIAACNGGGEILLPCPGVYLTGPINLTDNQALVVEEGAQLLGSQRLADYPTVPSFPSYQGSRDIPNSTCRYGAIVGAVNASNVTVTGGGVLDGLGYGFWKLKADKSPALKCSRPHLLEFEHCDGVTVDRVTLQNSPFWTSHYIYSNDIRITNVTVLAPATQGNTDGFNPDSSSNVFIKDCFVSNGDDGIAIKSGLNEAGIAYGKPSENIYIENVTTYGRGGIAMGSEMSGGIRNVTIKNVDLKGQRGIHMKTSKGRGGYFEDLTFIGCKGQAIQLWDSYSDGNASGPWPHINNLHFINNSAGCSVGCGKMPAAYCNASSFTFENSCGHHSGPPSPGPPPKPSPPPPPYKPGQNNLQLLPCASGGVKTGVAAAPRQRWRFNASIPTFQAVEDGWCLNLGDCKTADGTRVDLFPWIYASSATDASAHLGSCNGRNLQWEYNKDTKQIVSAFSKKCLEANPDPSALSMLQEACSTRKPAQQWTVDADVFASEGGTIISGADGESPLCLSTFSIPSK